MARDQSIENPEAAQHADELATARDTLLLELLLDVDSELSEAQLYLVRGSELRGHLACDEDGIDDRGVRHRRLPLSLLSVACRTANQGIPYFGPVPPTDPCSALVDLEALAAHGLALLPLRLGERTVALLLGHPRRPIDRGLRDVLCVLVHDAAAGLGELIAAARSQRRSSGEPTRGPADPRPRPTPTAPRRQPDEVNDEGLGDDTIDDAMQREPAQRPVFDVGKGSPAPRKRRKTLSGHPGALLVVGSRELPIPQLPPEDTPTTTLPRPSAPPPGVPDDDEGPVFLLTKKKRTAETEVNELDDLFDDEKLRTGTYVPPETQPRPSAAHPTGAERREHARSVLNVEVHVQREDGRFATAFMEDISVGGMFIASGSPPRAGERIELTFTLPGAASEVRVRGEVRWVRPGAASSGLAGVGLRFVDLSEITRDRVAAFIARS